MNESLERLSMMSEQTRARNERLFAALDFSEGAAPAFYSPRGFRQRAWDALEAYRQVAQEAVAMSASDGKAYAISAYFLAEQLNTLAQELQLHTEDYVRELQAKSGERLNLEELYTASFKERLGGPFGLTDMLNGRATPLEACVLVETVSYRLAVIEHRAFAAMHAQHANPNEE